MKALMLSGVVLFALAATPVFAQSGDTVATVEVAAGDVKTSDGGEFTSAAPGQRVESGHRLMLGEGARVTLRYDDNCQRTFDAPGVYTVSARCAPVAAASGRDGRGAALIAGGVAAGAAILANLDSDSDRPTPPPVSP